MGPRRGWRGAALSAVSRKAWKAACCAASPPASCGPRCGSPGRWSDIPCSGRGSLDLRIRGLGRLLQQIVGHHQDSRRAIAALQAVLFPKALLDGIELAVRGQPFHGRHPRSVGLDRQHQARLHRLPVEMHRASAAQARFASHVRSRQLQHVAQIMHQQQARFDFRRARHAVHRDRNRQFHGSSLLFHRMEMILSPFGALNIHRNPRRFKD